MCDMSNDYKHISYKWYADDTFLLYSYTLHVTKFSHYMNSKHISFYFTVEREENNSFSFRDITVLCDAGNLHTLAYNKLSPELWLRQHKLVNIYFDEFTILYRTPATSLIY